MANTDGQGKLSTSVNDSHHRFSGRHQTPVARDGNHGNSRSEDTLGSQEDLFVDGSPDRGNLYTPGVGM